MKRKLLLLTFAMPVCLCQNALAQSSRLMAESHWMNNGAAFKRVDSSYFNYSHGRGGDLTHTLKYDNYTTWGFVGDSAYNSWYYIQTFDSANNNNIATSQSQSWDTSTHGWVPVSNTLYTYNALNQVSNMIEQSWNGAMWVPTTENVYSYDSTHTLFSNVTQTWNSATLNWDPVSQKTYSFDVSHRLINESDQIFVSSIPVYTKQYGYAYGSAGQLLTTVVSHWNGAGWSYDTLYTNGYDSTSGNLITTVGQTFVPATSIWLNQTLHLYSNFTSAHLPQAEVYQVWDTAGTGSWNNVVQYLYTYNGFGQMTSSTGTSWNVVGVFEFAVGDPMSKYYYGTYVAQVKSVKSITNSGGDANVYPIPAKGTLHIDVAWDEAQASKISMYDMQGNVVRQWEAPVTKQYNSAVSVDNLSAGVYFIKINGTEGQIVKQIVIAH